MATITESTSLKVARREAEGSRAARRLRRAGNVPGVLYGGGEEPVAFAVDARVLRNTLAHAGAVLDLGVEDEAASPVMVKELTRHPVSGEIVHVDLLRVRMDVKIHSTVILDLTGAESAPGVRDGGVLEQVMREVAIEALPGDIPDSISHDVSGMHINDTLTMAQISAPDGVTILDDGETVIASVTPPTLEPVEDEVETETGLVGEEGAEGEVAEGQAEGDTSAEAEQSAADSDES